MFSVIQMATKVIKHFNLKLLVQLIRQLAAKFTAKELRHTILAS